LYAVCIDCTGYVLLLLLLLLLLPLLCCVCLLHPGEPLQG
jgi:hypothetical protein